MAGIVETIKAKGEDKILENGIISQPCVSLLKPKGLDKVKREELKKSKEEEKRN